MECFPEWPILLPNSELVYVCRRPSSLPAGADQAAVTFQLKDSANLTTTWYDSDLLAGNLKKYQVLNLGFNE